MKTVRNQIEKILLEYSDDFLFDFSCSKNRKILASKLEKSVMESIPCVIGFGVLRGKRKKAKKL